jgi:hypothetical protein
MNKLAVIAAYILLFATAVAGYVYYPTYRDDIKFWLPQALLALTLIMTSLYVLLTAELVSETRRLQQRPLLEVKFREVETQTSKDMQFVGLYSHGLGIYQGLARKMIEGEKVTDPPKSMVVELKNIGQTAARSVVVAIKLVDPQGSKRDQLVVEKALGRDEVVQLQIVPAPLPYCSLEIENLSYGDGLKNYSESTGDRVFDFGKV